MGWLTKDNGVANVRIVSGFIGKICRKLNSFSAVHTGLILCFVCVPSVLCISDWSKKIPLTYEQIYNTTSYAQLRPRNKPYNAPPVRYSPYNYRNSQLNDSFPDTKGNQLNYARKYSQDDRVKHQLLVGFARDPFRFSIPEADYLKGVREIRSEQYTNKDNRGKRGVVHLYNMLTCATGCNPVAYKGYGCYCGFLGSGRPADGIDNCCKMHDECYEDIRCPFYTVYFQPYYWSCFNGQPLCALENYQSQHKYINGCAGRLCECDRQFAMCVRRYSCPRGRPLCRSSPLRLLQNILMF
ncbi:uncharacterized protein [Epargyreus clarus]|uniref:uncharacterized protein n=1 Tax=Epargyreus clarus TaxID=520877 RepID=UPI003C2FAE90